MKQLNLQLEQRWQEALNNPCASRPPKAEQKNQALAPLPDSHPKLLTLYGPSRSGKDCIALYAEKTWEGVVHFAWSDLILEDLMQHFPDIIDQSNKAHLPYRRLLQEWAMQRRKEDSHYWTKKGEQKIQELWDMGAQLVIVTGSRDPHELRLVRSLGGHIWRVFRPGCDYKADHPVEQMLKGWQDYDATLHNDVEGDLGPLYEQVHLYL